ncbi:DNA-3-methyladenine glycosylase [Castellaniella sp.]|uniref:DNA-3-methyladenine glycosylase family protein n=1 Tax=Castellaniella sp. TaxID=1955812 RepID=UPI0035624D17
MDTGPRSLQSSAYWLHACEQLMQRDRILRKLIPLYQGETLRLQACPFRTLARVLIGQQVSLTLARSLWGRLLQACNDTLQPDCILERSEAELHALGLSKRKTQYLHDAARFFSQASRLDPAWWRALDDGAVVQQLCSIRGVGRRSADLFLIFHMGRPDILPVEDTSLLKAISTHYFSNEPVSRFEAREVAQAWVPWRSVASWHLWRSADASAVEY